ncbi:MarR family winged helix-turn-helix transcriptional regulator [Granulicoccus phenolivorans]|uniref:MarR family winged helix-turn-helix transcriptional regulator n=1 Tax=Granulicoccus phenolivorans TaxID=266854 RepID=UPI00040B8ABD|nr:MarR family transcriptional regulator [Granulicoccus phenolivorans]
MSDEETRERLVADAAVAMMGVSRRLSERGFHADRVRSELSPQDTLILRLLQESPGSTPKQIGERLGLRTSNTSAALRSLEERDLIRREPDATDGRIVHVYHSEAAGSALRRIRREMADILAPIDLTNAELERLVAACKQILDRD